MSKLAYQLYSSRNFLPFNKIVAMLVKAGYGEVEGFGGCYEDIHVMKKALDDNSLTMASGHFGLEMLESDLSACVKIAKAFGMQSIYVPYLVAEDRPADKQGWEAIGARLVEVGKKVNDAGFGFGWHNHDFELIPLADGTLPLDILLNASDDIQWEADLAWVVVGKQDPLEIIKRHQNKITSVHIKDIASEGQCTDEDGWADVGHGTMNWPALLTAVDNSPVKHFVLEHDNPSDDARFAKRSADFLKPYIR